MTRYCILFPLLFLAGCSPYYYRGEPLDLCSTDLEQNVQEAFDSSSVCEANYATETWWTFFQDPQLDHLIELSLAAHPTIKMAEARISLAYEEALEVRSTLLPHFFLFGNIAREKLSRFGSRTQSSTSLEYITEVTTYLASATYEVDIWKKNRNRYYSALDEMFAQKADYEEGKLLLSTTIASVYFELQYHLALLDLAKSRLKAREELYDLLLQRFKNGVISEFHLYETDIEVQMIQDLVLQTEGLIEMDRHALAALVGNVVCLELSIEPSAVFDTPLPLPRSLSIDLLARRPDVIAQKLRIQAACFDVSVAKANFLPQLDLVANWGFNSFKLTELFTKPTSVWLGEAVSVLPLFTAGKLEARLGVARESVEIAVESYNETVLNAVQQVSDSLTQLKTADRRLASLIRSVESAKALFDLTCQRFDNGVTDRISVLNGLENVLVQQEMETYVQLDRFQAAISLIQSIGGGYYDDCSG